MDDPHSPFEDKRCSTCKQTKPLAEFHVKQAARDGLQSSCKECNIARAKRFYVENLQRCRDRTDAWIRRTNEMNRWRVLEHLRENPCVDCGESDPVVLEFDHIEDKEHGIAELLHWHVRWALIEAEIAKCEVRCANCHRRRHAERADWFRHRHAEWAAWDSNPESTD